MIDLNIDNNIDKLVTIAMAKTGGIKCQAAELLGISVRSMYRIIKFRTENNKSFVFGSGRKKE